MSTCVSPEEVNSVVAKATRDPPLSFLCPITREIMRLPVFTADGHTYDRKAIEEWFSRGKITSPVTGEHLYTHHLVPNFALRGSIEEWRKSSGTDWSCDSKPVVSPSQTHTHMSKFGRKVHTALSLAKGKFLEFQMMDALPPTVRAEYKKYFNLIDTLGIFCPIPMEKIRPDDMLIGREWISLITHVNFKRGGIMEIILENGHPPNMKNYGVTWWVITRSDLEAMVFQEQCRKIGVLLLPSW